MAGENTTNTQRPWEGKSEPSQDQWLMFHEAVEQLNSDEKTLFELRFYQGMDLEQAAETLGISERTARRRWRNPVLPWNDTYAKNKTRCMHRVCNIAKLPSF